MSANIRKYPLAHDKQKADEIWATLKLHDENETLSLDVHKLWLDSIAGNSPFLSKTVEQNPEFTFNILTKDPLEIFDNLLAPFKSERPHGETKDQLMQALRRTKSKISLLTAAMDIGNIWSLDVVTLVLSEFADAALNITVAHLMWARMHKGELPWPKGVEHTVTPAISQETGYFILALGKHGAKELNYSSDIDLIVLYDATCTTYQGRKSLSECMIKLTQEMVEIMDRRTMHGYVFRTDLNLRPDPGATPVAIAVEAAESYYHSQALNWERSAMIKARFVAGDSSAARGYLDRMSGWIWRSSIDYEALNDIAAIKNQINRHYNQNERCFEGYNVKLGPGGIREIEFYAQINQLILGGRHVEFRLLKTLDVLDALNTHGRLENKIRSDLEKAYIFLRTLEHRLQMVEDEQTHQIPESEDAIKRIATFMNFDGVQQLKDGLLAHTATVEKHYDSLLPNSNPSEETPVLTDKRIEIFLSENNFKNTSQVIDVISGWRHGRYKSLQTKRSKILLEGLLPGLIISLGKNEEPNAAFTRFDNFLSKLPGGVQLFSLLSANPKLFDLLARIMGLAPALADTLAKRPTLWDAVLEPDFFAPLPDEASLKSELSHLFDLARDYQDILDIARRWVSEKKFQIGVHILENMADIQETGNALTCVVDATVKLMIPLVEEEFSRRHGRFDGGGIAMLAMGKYGGRELTHTSDLDVVFLYHCNDMKSLSDGKKALSPSQYFSRLGQNIITALTALTSEGSLFEVDTRLRPSGNSGPLVVTLKTFSDYYSQSAWTWEHMALTRARLIYAPIGLKTPLLTTITDALSSKRDVDALVVEVNDMRKRMAKEFGEANQWSIKNVRGGLIDIEFIIQFLLLKNGHDDPKIFTPLLDEAMERLAWQGSLNQGASDTLISAHWFLQSVQSVVRLCLTKSPQSSHDIPKGLYDVLCKATGSASFEDVQKTLTQTQEIVYSMFYNMIEGPSIQLTNKKIEEKQ